ncbi:hypothetical protein [Floridanema aerugineum]|uniref:Uncharacterized protein n=1 Tax=Floridaenema aerugineum BLCC-F46 TaxID=3153654 RepID=A0ABV4X886_9CYAN
MQHEKMIRCAQSELAGRNSPPANPIGCNRSPLAPLRWEKILAGQKPWLQPSHPEVDYLGEFANPSLGLLSITINDGCMVATYNDIVYILQPYCYDTFLATLAPYNKITTNGSPYPNPILLSYYTDSNGDLSRLSFPLEPALQELIFHRLPSFKSGESIKNNSLY